MLKQFFSSRSLAENGLFFIRLIAGVLITNYGLGAFIKGHMESNFAWLRDIHFPAPVLMAYIGKFTELVGGVLLILGLFTRVAAIFLVINMGVITCVMGNGKILSDDQHPFLLLLLFAVFFFTGAGKWSLDYLLFDRKPFQA